MKKLLLSVAVLSVAGAAFAYHNNCGCGCASTDVQRQVIKADKPCCVEMVKQYRAPKRHLNIVEEESWSCENGTRPEVSKK